MAEYTFDQLLAWKARSTDPNEQKKIRRLIRELRAKDPSLPTLRTGTTRLRPTDATKVATNVQQTYAEVNLANPETFYRVPPQNWTEDMWGIWDDWQERKRPLHQLAFIDRAGVPQYGCDCSKCTRTNWDIYHALLEEDLDKLAAINDTRKGYGYELVNYDVLVQAREAARAHAQRKLDKKAKKAAKKMKITKVSAV